MPKPERHVLVCMNTRPPGHPRGSCGSVGAQGVLTSFQEEFERKNLYDKALVSGSTCIGPCSSGPTVVVYPEGTWYQKVSTDDVSEIVDNHIINGKPVERLLLPDEVWG